MIERPIIGLDIDGVLADMAGSMVTIYNYKSICEGAPPFIKNDSYDVSDLVDYDFTKLIGKECFIEMVKTMESKEACSRLPAYNYSKRLYSKLCDIGNVIFITKPFSLYKNWYVERNTWIKKNFGVNQDHIIYTSKKHLINADILIDDCIDVIKDWVLYTNKPAIKVERPWNKDYKDDNVGIAKNLLEIPEIVVNLLKI